MMVGWKKKTPEQIVRESARLEARGASGDRYSYEEWVRSIDACPDNELNDWWRLHELFARRNYTFDREFERLRDLGGEG